ncbi:MAG: hypothetical protein H6582_08000 [Crocinitomicaceae bacterium]|nr:hypothetical protein [Crocinitomicaceae bacterium]
MILFFIGFSITSCQTSFGEKYELGNLEVYFTEEIDHDYVERTASYFQDNELIQAEKHSIQITSTPLGSKDPGFILKMIRTKNSDALGREDSLNLKLLEEDIRSKVFDGANFRIAVCNENFVEY